MTNDERAPVPPAVQRISQRIRAVREHHGITQQELANRVGLSRTSITNIEAGRHGMDVDLFLRLAAALQVSVADLAAAGSGPTAVPWWIDLAQRVTADERKHAERAEQMRQSGDVIEAARLRGIAKGLAMAAEHQLAAAAEAREGARR